MKTKYRITIHGAEILWWHVEKKVWWWPFWIVCFLHYPFWEYEAAEAALNRLLNPVVKEV